jgi:hypothetical protein
VNLQCILPGGSRLDITPAVTAPSKVLCKTARKKQKKQDMPPHAQEQDMSVQYETDDQEFGESKDVTVVEDYIYYETDEEEFNPGVSSHRFRGGR